MKLYNNLWGTLPVIALVLASCGPAAHIEKDPSASFDGYRTFGWAENKDGNHRQTITEQKVKNAISYYLTKNQGWKESRRNPDVLLSYDLLVERGNREMSEPVYSRGFSRSFFNPYSRRFYNVYYPSQFMGYDNYRVPTREGTITVTMTDAQTDRMVLQGWASEELNNRTMSTQEIDKVVKAIFKKMDVAMK